MPPSLAIWRAAPRRSDAVEVRFSGGERSATRYANSTITANLVEHDQEVLITVYYGQKSATTSTHQFDDDVDVGGEHFLDVVGAVDVIGQPGRLPAVDAAAAHVRQA